TKPFNTNPILEALGAGIRVQDDQVTDNDKYNRWAWEPRVYLVDHEVWYQPYAVWVPASLGAKTVKGGEDAVFTLTIRNDGTEADTYRIAVSSTKGWTVRLEREEVTLGPGETTEVRITVSAPKVTALTRDDLRATVTGTGVSATSEFRLTAEVPTEEEKREIPWTLIVAAVVIAVVVVAAAYLALRRGKKGGES
ncbi:MAG: FixG Ig-like domain-containing protein, partial [Candidatus Hadarchaeales archaeon]